MERLHQDLCALLEHGEDVAMATVVDSPGQGRLAGARMLIRVDGSTHGSIGGGEIEAEVLVAACRIFAADSPWIRVLRFFEEQDMASSVSCGRGTAVVIERIAAEPDTLAVFRELLETRQCGIKSCLVTPISEGCCNDRMPERYVIRYDGIQRSLKKDALLYHLPALQEKLRANFLPLIETIGGQSFFLNPWSIPETVYLCGAGHVAQETADIAARSGFRTIIMDDREKYANRERFPLADDVVVLGSFDECFQGIAVSSDSYVIIVTRGNRFEKLLVRQALRTSAGYIGLIGSIRKRDALFSELAREGFGVDDLLRVYCPTGMNILASTPMEIAVSIVAQLVLLRARKAESRKLLSRHCPDHSSTLFEPLPPEEVGLAMTSTADNSLSAG